MKASPKNLPDLPEENLKSRPSLRRQRPFMISRLDPGKPDSKRGDDEKKLKLCKKCERMTIGMSFDSIHSTLAYSRCRCHRLFTYRKQTQESLSPAMANEGQTIPNLHGGMKLGASNRGIKLEPLHNLHGPRRKSEDVGGVPKVKQKRAGGVRTKDGATLGCALPLLSAVSIVCEKPPVGSVLEFSGSSVVSPVHLPIIPIVNTPPLPPKRPSATTSHTTELTGMVKFIDPSKRKQLRDVFQEIDKNGDGHITLEEFLCSLPECSLANISLLKQFYVVLNDATYFGCREFMLCYCIAERLRRLKSSDVAVDFVGLIVSPFMKFLARLANDGYVRLQDIKDSVADVNRELGSSISISVSESPLTQVMSEGKCDILDCLALASYILSCKS